MKLICAQPDKPLFLWQLKVLISSLLKLNVAKENIHFLMLIEDNPSPEALYLAKYATVHYYKDNKDRFYYPSSKPYLFAKYFEEFPQEINEYYLYIESDMLVFKLPEIQPQANTIYWSDASAYLEVNKYETMFGFHNQNNKSIGFHWYAKNLPPSFWYKVEEDSIKIAGKLLGDRTGDNIWISEMRALMWNAKASGQNNVIHTELAFSDGRGIKINTNLYHHLEKKIVNKRSFANSSPFNSAFSVHPAFAAHHYVEAIKEAKTL